MTNKEVLFRLTDMCDIYFEDALISKERIVEKYADFFLSSMGGGQRSVSIALHTGSICFDIVSFIIAALGCISLDKTNADEIVDSLNPGDMVLYKNERYRWLGVEQMNGSQYMKLQQDNRGKNGPTTRWVLFEANKGLIRPYLGESEITDGRGIKKAKSDRADFISFVFGTSKEEVSSVTGVSTVIVAERDAFKRIADGLKIIYGNGKSIGLLEIVTASYFTDSGEEYQFGSNPAKTEPVLKITGKVSTARDLVLDKRGNPVVGLMVIGTNSVAKGGSELADLLSRKSLKFAHIATDIDFEGAEDIVETQPDAAVFACTKEFLLNNSLPVQERNSITTELDRQVCNIVNNTVTVINVDDGCSWEEMKKAREALYTIKQSDWSEDKKNDFIINAHSLLNLLSTAVFPLRTLEAVVSIGKLNVGVASPSVRISELWNLAQSSGSMEYSCAYVVDVIERFYQALFEQCPKYDALVELLTSGSHRRLAVIVPKAYYIDILADDERIVCSGATIVTANRFDATLVYDEVIAVGDIFGKRFDPLKCRAAEDIVVLLYECETHTFRHKNRRAKKFEKKLNTRGRVIDDEAIYEDTDTSEETAESENIDAYVEGVTDLERFIDGISIFDIRKFAAGASVSAGNAPTSEVCAVGRFTSGEQILFSKYYNAVVFDSGQGAVTETEPEKLSDGDVLIFVKHDDYTQNMVDYIYEGLLSSRRLSKEVSEATERAFYWKEALREYKNVNGLSYRDIAAGLRKLGSSLQEVSVRQWLIEESHIVGPRDEKTLEQVAQLTGDPYLLNDTQTYFDACRIVRRQRKEILGLIGKAITDRLGGHIPPKGSLLEAVYENVEKLSESLELESITVLDEPICVPINLINKPLTDAEVSI